MTLFGSYSYDGLNATLGVQHTEVTLMMVGVLVYGSYIEVPNLGASW